MSDRPMIRQIAPQFFTTEMAATLAYYKEQLRFDDKYADELLDAYLFIEDADTLYAEYAARGVEFTRALGDTPWHSREFVVKDCDGRLLAFGPDPGPKHSVRN